MIANTTHWTYDVGPPFLDTTLHPMAMVFMGLLDIILYELTQSRAPVSINNYVPQAVGLAAHDDTSYDYEDNFIDDSGAIFSKERDNNSDSAYTNDIELTSLERNLSVHPLVKPPGQNQQDNLRKESFESEHTSSNKELLIKNNLHDSEKDIWDINSSMNEIESNSAENGQKDSLKSREITLGLLRNKKLLVESASNEIKKSEELSSSTETTKNGVDVSENNTTKSRGERKTTNNVEKDDNSLDKSETNETDSEEKTREFMKQLQKVRFQFRKNSKSSSESASSSISSDSSESQDSYENQRSPVNDFLVQFQDNPWDDFNAYNDPENELQFLFSDSPFEAPLSYLDLLSDMLLVPDYPFGMMNRVPLGMQKNNPKALCELNECENLPTTPVNSWSPNPILDNSWLPNPTPAGSNLQAMIRRDGAIPISPFDSPMEPIYHQVRNPFLGFNENTPEEEMGNIFFEDNPNEEDGLDDESPVVVLIISRYEHTIYPEDIFTPEELVDCPQEPFLPDRRMEEKDLNVPQMTQNAPQIVQNVPQITPNLLQMTQNAPQIVQNLPQITQNAAQKAQNLPQMIQNAPLIMNQGML